MPSKRTPLWIHSTPCKYDGVSAYIVKEKIHVQDEQGNVTWEDHLRFFDNPTRCYWLTKPAARNHKYKKELEQLENLDQYTCLDSELETSLKRNLDIWNPRAGLRSICNQSPYIYGADIDTGVLIRGRYKQKAGCLLPKLTKGSLDIEAEVTGDKRINVITFIHETEMYTAVLAEYMYKVDDTGQRVPASYDDLIEVIERLNGPEFKEDGYTYQVHIAPTELNLIKWIFKQIHRCKTDFIGIWNIDYDIPRIMDRIVQCGGNLADILCHPDVPRKYRRPYYFHDGHKVEHPVDKWHWCYFPGYSQFVDRMCLYGRIRKAKGKESTYSLDYIATKVSGKGKLKTTTKKITNHAYEQKYNFLPYVAYNQIDSKREQDIEVETNDYDALLGLTDVSLLSDFNKQMVMAKNSAYFYQKNKGRIIASVGNKVYTPFDKELTLVGGTVLPPNKGLATGIAVLKENPYLSTQVTIATSDLDVASEYPSVCIVFNIAKETKLATALRIEGRPTNQIEPYFSNVSSPRENAVWICSHYYNLPDYQTMLDIFDQAVRSGELEQYSKVENY